jgi:addiction module HigA family antidote
MKAVNICVVIRSFAEMASERIWRTGKTRGSPPASVTRRKLAMLDAATKLDDLRVPPGNRLEKLAGDRKGQHSIRINDQYRICFAFRDGDAYEVEITDYHQEPDRRRTMAITRSGTAHWRVHPGEILREEFLKPFKLSAYAVAKAIRVPPPRVNDIVLEKRGITTDTAVRLAKFFGTSEQFWLSLQASYEINQVKRARREELDRIEPLSAARSELAG